MGSRILRESYHDINGDPVEMGFVFAEVHLEMDKSQHRVMGTRHFNRNGEEINRPGVQVFAFGWRMGSHNHDKLLIGGLYHQHSEVVVAIISIHITLCT